jgi:hypothetical protein
VERYDRHSRSRAQERRNGQTECKQTQAVRTDRVHPAASWARPSIWMFVPKRMGRSALFLALHNSHVLEGTGDTNACAAPQETSLLPRCRGCAPDRVDPVVVHARTIRRGTHRRSHAARDRPPFEVIRVGLDFTSLAFTVGLRWDRSRIHDACFATRVRERRRAARRVPPRSPARDH